MSSSESGESDNRRLEDASSKWRKGFWRPVSKELWRKRERPQGIAGAVSTHVNRVMSFISSPGFFIFFLAPLGGLGASLTFYLAYALGGAGMFGIYFIAIWATVIIGAVAVIEKTGYSRNFEGWDFPLRSIAALPIAFLIVAGIFFLLHLIHTI